MIEHEIIEIIGDRADTGERLSGLVDQFRRGRDVAELLPLLNSRDSELISIGAWILGELPFELYDLEDLVSRLRELTDHEDPAVRFHALGALFPALDRQDLATKALLSKMCNDPNEGVRRSAEAVCRSAVRGVDRACPKADSAPR